MNILLQRIHLSISSLLYLVFIYQYKNSLLLFREDYENPKRSMRRYLKHISRNVQKSVQGDGERNGHNCITEGDMSTTMLLKYM